MSPCTYIQHNKNTLKKPFSFINNMYGKDLVPTLVCRVKRQKYTKTDKEEKKRNRAKGYWIFGSNVGIH